MQRFLILNGVHTAGKTSIGQYLEEKNFNYQPEIAQQLIDEHNYDPGKDSNHAFQEEIFEREKARDERLLERESDAVIETWHTGSLAHAIEVADEDIVRDQRSYISRILSQEELEVETVHLEIPHEYIMERTDIFEASEKDDVLDFFDRIETNLNSIYDRYDIPVTRISNEGELDKTRKEVLQHARREQVI